MCGKMAYTNQQVRRSIKIHYQLVRNYFLYHSSRSW